MIENFEPQPYPLECSADGETWALVIGWQKNGDGRLTPVVPAKDGGLGVVVEMATLRYRPADVRQVAVRPTIQPAAAARSERSPRTPTSSMPTGEAFLKAYVTPDLMS